MASNPLLNYEPSHNPTNPTTSSTLPPEVSQCLQNAQYLHLATISRPSTSDPLEPPQPHVSLMNYTFLPNYRDQGPVILMTTNNHSLKTQNLRANPRVSLLVHDWSSHRPPRAMDTAGMGDRTGSPTGLGGRSSLASMLFNLNTSALSSISTTISSQARFLEPNSDEEKWCKEAHLANNTFEGQLSTEAGYFSGLAQPSARTSGYIEGDDVRVVLVPVRRGRISDFKGAVRDWQVVDDDQHIPVSISDAADPTHVQPPMSAAITVNRGPNEALPNGVPDIH